jgi:gamma-D-glutamyl-L-lysine dipeptidyl-peptidase
MSAAICTAALAPVVREPGVRGGLETQWVCGETAAVISQDEAWLRLRLHQDGAEGWVHEGYLRLVNDGEAEHWRTRAAWSEGALLQMGTTRQWLPLRARVVLADGEVELPDGRFGRVTHGRIRAATRAQADARQMPPEEWARTTFAGAPYLWGGVTPHGVDCSGLVQTTWMARGVNLPRQAADQALAGAEVPFAVMRAGDLLCFRDAAGDTITHVGVAGPDSTLVHAALAAGGVVVQSWLPGQPAAALLARLATVRRLDGLEAPAHA